MQISYAFLQVCLQTEDGMVHTVSSVTGGLGAHSAGCGTQNLTSRVSNTLKIHSSTCLRNLVKLTSFSSTIIQVHMLSMCCCAAKCIDIVSQQHSKQSKGCHTTLLNRLCQCLDMLFQIFAVTVLTLMSEQQPRHLHD